MTAFRILLMIIFVAITTFTVIVVSNHGIDALPRFFGDMAKMEWPGLFNFDFMCFLALTALWLAWRHEFSPAGLMIGFIAFFGGALFLSAYLLITSYQVKGNINAMLLGPNRAKVN